MEMTARPSGEQGSFPKDGRFGDIDTGDHKVSLGFKPAKVYKLVKYRTIQIQVYNFLERPRTTTSIAYHSFVFFLIVTSLLLSILATVSKFEKDPGVDKTSYILEYVLLGVFSCEYILRLWSCSSHGTYAGIWGKVKFIKKPYMVIDIIVIVATGVVFGIQGDGDYFNISMLRFLRFVQVLRILRLDRQRGAFKMVSQVVYEHRQELLTCWYMSFIILITCSFLVYLAERQVAESSGKMVNLADGVYWGIISFLTIGYGDIAPQSWVSKLITCVFSLVGTAFFALPAGILGSGFALQVAQQQRQKHFNRRRVPAARLIQACWRRFAAHFPNRYPATWFPTVVYLANRNCAREFSKVSQISQNSPLLSNKVVAAFLRRKLQSTGSAMSVDGQDIDEEVPAAAVPLAVCLQERCHSEGNLVIGDENIDENQDTVISLPGKVFGGGDRRKSKALGEALKELTNVEKNALRFLRHLNLVICIRKFREARRPYDVKDVLEEYASGQMEMFGRIKKLQGRLESAIGFKGKQDKDIGKVNVIGRLNTVETKVVALDKKLDLIIGLLENQVGNTKPKSPLIVQERTRKSRKFLKSQSEVEGHGGQRNKQDIIESAQVAQENLGVESSPPRERSHSRFKVTLLDKDRSGEKPVNL